MSQSRRGFLKRSLCAALGTAGASTMIDNLRAFAATGSQGNDYKALVCVFLYGGNDGDNTIVPYGQSEYNAYAAARSNLSVPRASLLPIQAANTDGRQFAFHPSMPEFQALFGQKKLAVVANCGPLLAPVTRSEIRAGTAPLPPQLFSHNDQQVHWQTSWPDQLPKTGWGGRMADLVDSFNSNPQVSMSISLTGSNVYQIGSQVFPYMVSPEGTISLWYYNEAWGNPETILTKGMLEMGYSNLFEKSYGEIFKRAIDNEKRLNAALAKAPALTTVFPEDLDLADQLKMVARLISIRGELGMRRQIFFCAADGFDTHGEQINTHANLLVEVSRSMDAFYRATVELGVADLVTAFTCSDFGRTYKSNGKGSDHGWGNHQFVLGGAVRGGDFYGQVPVHQIGGPDDTSDGRWIPTISTDEYAATLARWFGVNSSDLPLILPNIGRFNRPNLGFL
ncbi:MAG: DUF1501 domain-containing protein [Acidobacteriota bacterium]|nr:MAG: DUF1501 domain-containing protein [Acidobacteriota bacterium]